jgi:hypothetical protein
MEAHGTEGEKGSHAEQKKKEVSMVWERVKRKYKELQAQRKRERDIYRNEYKKRYEIARTAEIKSRARKAALLKAKRPSGITSLGFGEIGKGMGRALDENLGGKKGKRRYYY